MTDKLCTNCIHYIEDNMDCSKGNLTDGNIVFEDGEYRVKCDEWEEVQSNK